MQYYGVYVGTELECARNGNKIKQNNNKVGAQVKKRMFLHFSGILNKNVMNFSDVSFLRLRNRKEFATLVTRVALLVEPRSVALKDNSCIELKKKQKKIKVNYK